MKFCESENNELCVYNMKFITFVNETHGDLLYKCMADQSCKVVRAQKVGTSVLSSFIKCVKKYVYTNVQGEIKRALACKIYRYFHF